MPSFFGAIGQKIKRLFRSPKMTLTRQRIYDAALNSLKPSDNLRKLAAAYRNEGLHEQADLLEKRADLKDLPDHIRAERRLILKDALTWSDPAKIRSLAAVYDRVGSTGAAALLRRYAAGLPKTFPVINQTEVVRRRRRMPMVKPVDIAHETSEVGFDPPFEDFVPENSEAPTENDIASVREELEIEPIEISVNTSNEETLEMLGKIEDPNSGINSGINEDQKSA